MKYIKESVILVLSVLIRIIQSGAIINDPTMVPVESWDQKLKQYFYLTNKYDNNAFPSDSKLKVQLSLSMYGIVAIDQINNKVILRVTLRYQWQDLRLAWNPADFGGMTETLIDIETKTYKIWIPDFTLVEADGKSQFEQLDLGYAQLHSDGFIYASRAGQIRLNHKFNLLSYPFDSQNIKITIKSLNYDINQLEIVQFALQANGQPRFSIGTFEQGYVQHLQWKMVSFTGQLGSGVFYDRTFSTANYKFEIKRNGKTSVNVMFIPGMMISIQSFNTFFIKIEAPLRIQFATATLLTLIMFLIMITKFIPITSEDPFMELLFLRLVSSVFMIEVFIILQQFYFRKFKKQKEDYQNNCNAFKLKQLQKKYKELKKIYKAQQQELLSEHSNNEEEQKVEEEQHGLILKVETLTVGQPVPPAKVTWQQKLHYIQKHYLFRISPAYIDRIGFVVFCTIYIIQQTYTIQTILRYKRMIQA